MDALESEITLLEDKIEKTEARRKATEMSAHSNEYLHSNLQIAMQYLDKAPQDAQIALLQALIKIIKVYDDHVKMEMFITKPDGDIELNLPQKQQTPLLIKEQGSTERQQWRLVVDARRTQKALETSLLIKLYQKRSMGSLISLGEPIDTSKPYQRGILSNYR